MSARVPVITIDGPGGSGKGTISRSLAQRLGWHWLDSGALYRILGLQATRAGVDLADAEALQGLCGHLEVAFDERANESVVLLAGEDVTLDLRTEQAGAAASQVAAHPVVRTALLAWQRAYCTPPGLVADGRDMGTVVFPGADLKVYLTASLEERARRRYNQLKQQGFEVSIDDLLRDIAQRDERDTQRAVAPLRPAADAVVIDSSRLTIDEVLQEIAALVATKLRGLV
ncbi:MAG: (d)CMP kinase [Thiotrichales bacterium]